MNIPHATLARGFFSRLFSAVTLALIAAGPAMGQIADTWTGTLTTNFETAGNWSLILPPLNDTSTNYAVFNSSTYTNQPTLTMSRSIGGLQFKANTVTLAGGFTLTLGDVITASDGTANVGIDASQVTSGTDTVNVATLVMNSNQTWLVGTGGTLQVNSVIKDGSTATTLTLGDGTANGIVQLFGANTFSGGLVISSGTADLGTSTSAGTGTITLGNSAANATLTSDKGNHTIANAISVGGTGTDTITETNFNPTYSGAITLANNLNIVTNNSAGGPIVVSGAISGTGNLILRANGALGANNGSITLSGATINNMGTIDNDGTGTVTTGNIGVTISASIGSNVTNVIEDSANSSLTLNGVDTYQALTILAGTAIIKTSNSLGSGPIVIGDSTNTGAAATLNLNLGGPSTFTNTISTAGTGVNTITITNWTADFTSSVTLNSNLTLISNNPADSILQFDGGITGTGNVTSQVLTTNTTSQVIIGLDGMNFTGSFTNNGTGVGTTQINGTVGSNITNVIEDSPTSALVLNGNAANDFQPQKLTILAGTVMVIHPLSLVGSSAAPIVLGDSTNTGAAATLNFNLSAQQLGLNSTVLVTGTGLNTISITSWNVDFTNLVTLNSNLTLVSNNSNNSYIQLDGGITGTGNVTTQVLTTNTGSKVIIGTDGMNFSGTFTNNGSGLGFAQINGPVGSNVTNVIEDSPTSALNLNGNVANDFQPQQLTILSGTVIVSNPDAIQGSTPTPIVIGDSTNTGAAATLNTAAQATFNNPISTVGTGVNTITVTNWNPTFSGAITLNSNLTLNSNNSGGSAVTFTGGISGTGNVTLQVNNNSTASKITLGAINNVGTITNNGSGPGSAQVSGVIGSNVTGVIENSPTSMLVLSGVNTYTSATTVTAGTLQAGSTQAFGVNSVVTIANTSGAILDLKGFNNSIGSLSGGGTTGGEVTTSSGSAVLTTGGNNSSTTFAGQIMGAVSLIKTGSSTMNLSGANTYTGPTTVSSGTLTVTGSLASTTLNVIGGSLLFGAANPVPTTASVNLGGGTLGVTTGGGSTTLGALTLQSATTSILDFGAASASVVLSFTTFTIPNNTAILDVYDYNNNSGSNDHFVLSSGPGTEVSYLTQIYFYSGNGTGFLGTGSEIAYSGGGIEIVPGAVPERTSLMPLGFLGLLLFRGSYAAFLKRLSRLPN